MKGGFFMDEYNKEQSRPVNPRRRKRSKAQIFKEVYLPVIIAGIALLLIIIFIIGAIVRGVQKNRAEKEASIQASISILNEQARLAEEEQDVLLAEEVPGDDRGECEEQQTNCNEDVTETGTEYGTNSHLHSAGLGDYSGCTGDSSSVSLTLQASQNTVSGVQAGDDNQSGHGQNHESIDEHTDHSHNTLVMGLCNICHSVCVGSRTHTCLVGEQTSLCALADCGLQSHTKATADDCLRNKSILENHTDCFR